MKVNFHIGNYLEEHAEFYINHLSSKVEAVANELRQRSFILGEYHSKVYSLKVNSLIRFYTRGKYVMANDGRKSYQVRQRIYELRNILPHNFLQVSRSEIVNFHDVDHLEIVRGGIIKLVFDNHQYTFVARRYVPKIRKRLGI